MDDIVSRVQKQILKDIRNYFKNEDINVLMVCNVMFYWVTDYFGVLIVFPKHRMQHCCIYLIK